MEKIFGNVENEIPDVSGLVKKTVYDVKISEIERKYFVTADSDKLARSIFDIKVREKELVDKSNISILVKNSELSKNLNN